MAGSVEPDDCVTECGRGESNYTTLLAPRFAGAGAGNNASLIRDSTMLYRGVTSVDGQRVAARVSVSGLVDATWLGHLPGLAAAGVANSAAGLRFQPTCAGRSLVEVTVEFVGDDGYFGTLVTLPLVRLAVYGLGGGGGGANVTVMATESGGLYAIQVSPGFSADVAGRTGELAVTLAAPSVAPDAARDAGAALLLAAVNRTVLRFAAGCAPGWHPAPLTVALAGAIPPALEARPPTELVAPPGPCFPCPAGTYKAVIGPDPCMPCPAGTYRGLSGGQSQDDCSLCPDHTSSAELGAFAADTCDCDAGFEPDGGSAAPCAPCKAGTYRGEDDSECVKCPAGTYSPWRAATDVETCQPCPDDTATIAPGASSVVQCFCRAGLYRVEAGRCAPCPAGQYSDAATSGKDSCFRCLRYCQKISWRWKIRC